MPGSSGHEGARQEGVGMGAGQAWGGWSRAVTCSSLTLHAPRSRTLTLSRSLMLPSCKSSCPLTPAGCSPRRAALGCAPPADPPPPAKTPPPPPPLLPPVQLKLALKLGHADRLPRLLLHLVPAVGVAQVDVAEPLPARGAHHPVRVLRVGGQGWCGRRWAAGGGSGGRCRRRCWGGDCRTGRRCHG